MIENNKLKKAEDFALLIIGLYKNLWFNKKEYVMSKQILRSATSIGANIAEADCAESHQDFIHKINISLKEANETCYWLRLLVKSGYITQDEFTKCYKFSDELVRILSAILISSKGEKKYHM